MCSLAVLDRQLSCQSWKVKSRPAESLVPPQFHSFMSNPRRIYILYYSYLVLWWILISKSNIHHSSKACLLDYLNHNLTYTANVKLQLFLFLVALDCQLYSTFTLQSLYCRTHDKSLCSILSHTLADKS